MDSDCFHAAIDAEKVGKGVQFAAAGTQILAHETEANFSGLAGRHTQGEQFSVFQTRLNAMLWQPPETEPAANGVDRSLNCGYREEALRGTARLMSGSRGYSLNGHQHVLQHLGARQLLPERVERVIPPGDGEHRDVEDWLDEKLARHQARHTEL
jgi:hypothetical protein